MIASITIFADILKMGGLKLNFDETTLLKCFANVFHSTRIAMHSERTNRHKAEDKVEEGAVPAYLLDREATARAKASISFDFLKYFSWL